MLQQKNSFFLLLGRFTSRRRFSETTKLLIVIFFSSFIFMLDFFKTPYILSLKDYSAELISPIKIFTNKIIELPKILYQYVDLKNENKELRIELEKLQLKTITTSNMKEELLELRKFVNLKYQSDSFEFMEKVLGFDNSIFNSFLLISRTQPSTQKDSVVISSDGLVGIISSVYKKTAKVLPLTASKMFIPVKNDSGEHLILKGTGDNKLISVEIQSSVTKYIKINDTLYTSGEGGIYKAGIPVAKIIDIDQNQTKIYAKPIADLNKLNYIWTIFPIG